MNQLKDEILIYAKLNMAPSTYELYKKSISNLIQIIGNKRLTHISMLDIERFKIERVQSVSKTSANMEIRTVKAIFNFAVKSGMLRKSPAIDVKQFKMPEREKKAFSHEELQQLFSVITDPIIGRMVIFALHTGCRLSEILNIQIKDINFEEKYITIRNKADFKTKTGRIRNIPISESVEIIIKPYNISPEDNYLFSFNGPERLNKDFVSHKFKKYLRKSGMAEKFHFHCLRHTFITNLIKSGVSINFVKELAGHTDIQTTMGYVHIGLEDLRMAVNKYNLVI